MKPDISIVFVLSLCGGLLHVYNAASGQLTPMQMRPIHLFMILCLAFLSNIQTAKRRFSTIANAVYIALALLTTGYIVFFFKEIAFSAGIITTEIVIFGSILAILVLIVSRQSLGNVLSLVAAGFICYALFGSYLPSPFGHRGYSIAQISNFLYTTGDGIFGVPIDVSTRYLVLFMILSEFISRSGTDRLFMGVALFIAQRTRGGAAKASVVASSLFGTISGTPIANVMVTGAFTIPMMKKSGFPSYFAAAVEAAASTGGLIMPPIMGAGAFVMAEILGIPYTKIMKAAIIPAILYYLSLYIAIHLFSKKRESIELKSDDNESATQMIFKYIHTIIPLTFFIVSVALGYSVFRGALLALALTPFVSWIRSYTRMSFWDIIEGISQGMLKCVKLGAACGAAGIIVGVIALTGFGFSFADLLSLLPRFPFIALCITALLCIVLGMGMPAVASYLIVATLAVPSLVKFGFLPLAAHLFIFYFSTFSTITPPVALTTYSAAGLADSEPWKSGLHGFLLASVAFLAPFLFIYSPSLLGLAGIEKLLYSIPTAIAGVFLYVSGLQGFFIWKLDNLLLRLLLVLSGCMLIAPDFKTDMIALSLVMIVFLFLKFSKTVQASC